MIDTGVLSISTRAYHGVYEDQSGKLICQIVGAQAGFVVARQDLVPDDYDAITACLVRWADEAQLGLILTTGGTGFSPNDLTPEATRAVIEREAPGLAEAMRAASLAKTPHAMLSRAVCGIRGHTLIVNLPGSPKAVRENLAVILPVLPHGVALLREDPDTRHEFGVLCDEDNS